MASGRSLLLLLLTVLLLLLVIDRGGPSHSASVSATTPGPFDLDEDKGLRAAVDAVGSELVLLTTNAGGVTSAVNMALQLRRVGLTAVLVLADRRSTCTSAHASWPWLRCGWSKGLGTFERYRDAPMVSREERLLWALWSAKWLTTARLVDMRVTVLALDSDAFILTNPFALLNAPPLSHYAMVVPAEGARVNIGFLYVRGASVSPGGGASSVLWDVVRRLRIFTGTLTTAAVPSAAVLSAAAHAMAAPTAAALAMAALTMAEEETLLDAAPGPNRGKPRLLGLWDQGVFTDALASAAQGEHIYPYTYSISPTNAIWSRLRWPAPASQLTAANASRMHGVRWRPRDGVDRLALPAWRRHAYRPRGMSAPPGNPQRRSWDGGEALHWQVYLPWLHYYGYTYYGEALHWQELHPRYLLWLCAYYGSTYYGYPQYGQELHPLPPLTGLTPNATRRARAPRWATDVRPLAPTAAGASPDLLLAATDWLYCSTGWWMIRAGWLALRPRYAVCSVLHLVELRSQFAHSAALDTLKRNRDYVLQAYLLLTTYYLLLTTYYLLLTT